MNHLGEVFTPLYFWHKSDAELAEVEHCFTLVWFISDNTITLCGGVLGGLRMAYIENMKHILLLSFMKATGGGGILTFFLEQDDHH